MELTRQRRAGAVWRQHWLCARLGRGGLHAPEAAFKLLSVGSCPAVLAGQRGASPAAETVPGSCAGPSALSSWLLYLPHLLEKLGAAVETFGPTLYF